MSCNLPPSQHRPLRAAMPRRRVLLAGTAAAVALAACTPLPYRPASPAGPVPRLRLAGEQRLPHRLQFKGTTVGGLSGLDFDAATGIWYALSDDRSELAPARFYTLRLPLSGNGLGAPELLDVVTLRGPGGLPYPSRRQGGEVVDPESIRFVPGTGGRPASLLWTSEGDQRLDLDPFVREVALDGRHLREFALPPQWRMRAVPGNGPRDNLALEGLTLVPGGASAWAAMEAPLQQDGPVPAVGAPGGPCRFTEFDMASGRALRQRAYLPDAIPSPAMPSGGHADNGVSEILMADAHRMLVLERAYMAGVGNSLRLYQVDTRDGSDTLDQDRLEPGSYRPMAKRLVADFATLGISRLDNTESMAWGPSRPWTSGTSTGGRTLVFVSDDNFTPGQVTQFLAFDYLE